MSKFFIKNNQICNDIIKIYEGDAKHISNVLRCKIGEEIVVCDEDGYDYICNISEITKDVVILKPNNRILNQNESSIKITLFQGLAKGDKMDLVIQKSVEIGVSCIVPMVTDRAVVRPNDKSDKKISRFNKISESASKQSKRGKIPTVTEYLNFKEAVAFAKNNLEFSIIPYELEKENSLKNICKNIKHRNIGIFIGPEGGFSQDEIDFAVENGIIPISLGKRILRSETAGLVASAIVIYELED